MGQAPIVFQPGVNIVSTSLSDNATFSDSNNIRFFADGAGKVWLQKRGGWTRLTNQHVIGTPRGMHAFFDLLNNAYIGIGTEQVLELYNGGQMIEITPVARQTNVFNPFATHAGSATVTVTDPNYQPSVGDFIYIATSAYVGGLILQGLFQVKTSGAGSYTIQAAAPATQNVAAGGATFQFTSQLGSPVITFTQGAAVYANGSSILVYVPTAIGGSVPPAPGIVIAGTNLVTMAGGIFSITPGQIAAANQVVSENGGAVNFLYLLPSQLDSNSIFLYGIGRFGVGAFGFGEGSAVGGVLNVREWSIDNFGAIMLASPKGGPIYAWTPPIAYNNRAIATNSPAPQFSTSIFVAMPQEQVISLGSDGGGFQDPLLVRFSDVGNFIGASGWVASAINQAGSYRLTSGGRIVGGMQGPQQGYIWTDQALWTMNYIGFPLVYGFNKVADGCGLLAMRAAGLAAGRLIWPGHNGFWEYTNGGVVPVPCSVWDFFYSQRDNTFVNLTHAFPNSDFTEIAWHFARVGDNGVPMAYIKLNLTTNTWDKGVLTRTSGIDRSDIAPPVGADGANGFLQAHETQTDADGVAMTSFALTSWFYDPQGAYLFIERLIPDFVFNPGGSVNIFVYLAEYVGDAPRIFGPFTANAAKEFIITDCRDRLVRLYFDFSPFGSFTRMGMTMRRGAAAGRG